MPVWNRSQYHIDSGPKKILVGFGDIINFFEWERRNSLSREEFRRFIKGFKSQLTHLQSKGYFLKHLGDGAMFIKEMKGFDDQKRIVDFLCDSNFLYETIMDLIKSVSYPRPKGFRIRIALGEAEKTTEWVPWGKCVNIDYTGYIVDMAFKLLMADKNEAPLLCHESVKDALSFKTIKKRGIIFNKWPRPKLTNVVIDSYDLDALWKFGCQKPHKK